MSIEQVLTQQETRRTRRRKGKAMFEFPLDLLIEILIRLPTISLMRFKCVSKQWLPLIFCRHLCNSLFTVTRKQQQPRLYMCLVDKEFRKRVLLSISSTSLYNTCFVVDQDLSISGMGGFFLGVVRGLMCFFFRENVCIYNPSTKQLLTLPAIKPDIIAEECQRTYTRCFIGHDPVSDQYKLFCTITISYDLSNILKSEHWVFVLEAGGSWRKVVPSKFYRPHNPLSIEWSTNGSVIHYMALLGTYTCAVVSFDVRSEELTMFPEPSSVGAEHLTMPAIFMNGGLVEYGAKIAIFDHNNLEDKGFAVLWVLKDVGRDKWSKKKMVLQPCQRHLVGDTKLVVKGTTQDGKVILAPSEMRSPFYILCYDMQSNDLRKVEIKGIPQLWFDKECYFDLKFMDENESFVYLET